MKSKMRITGNRTVIGVICIVLALGITFGIAPLVNRFTDRKVEVVQVKQNVERGHLITEDDVELVKVGALNLSDRTVKNKKYVVGKYAATNLYAGQIMIVRPKDAPHEDTPGVVGDVVIMPGIKEGER